PWLTERHGYDPTWPDARLVAAVRDGEGGEAALDALVRRHWPALVARCELLTLDREAAHDRAQDAWVRVLRARRELRPELRFGAYLATIATNLWRDRQRAARRAGALAERRLASLDVTVDAPGRESIAIADDVAAGDGLPAGDRTLLRLDLDRALARLSPRTRDVLIARHLDGESAAEIARRYGRTEQTVTAWLRRGADDLRRHLGGRRD
ncbi:sigma-70 family RNA polymerase sigma factor, partial [Roseisolibacter sp. H3M3-2]|uniref:RNA polymerase sigma factor n=1 Tax=Roseisolibacter sp. H3M3-2 TaxID=3031323 RepID=UPI0023DAC387